LHAFPFDPAEDVGAVVSGSRVSAGASLAVVIGFSVLGTSSVLMTSVIENFLTDITTGVR